MRTRRTLLIVIFSSPIIPEALKIANNGPGKYSVSPKTWIAKNAMAHFIEVTRELATSKDLRAHLINVKTNAYMQRIRIFKATTKGNRQTWSELFTARR